jgi:Transposase IS66 family
MGLLEVYLKEGTIEIDNNLVENSIRPTALGRTGCFSAMPKPETAAPYSTPSSNAVADAAWNPSLTCVIC